MTKEEFVIKLLEIYPEHRELIADRLAEIPDVIGNPIALIVKIIPHPERKYSGERYVIIKHN